MEGRGDQGPGLVEALALVPAARGQDRLGAARAPAHAALFESLGDERFTRGLDDAGADHEPAGLEVRVAHAFAVLAEVGERLADRVATRMLIRQMLERAMTFSTPCSSSRRLSERY